MVGVLVRPHSSHSLKFGLCQFWFMVILFSWVFIIWALDFKNWLEEFGFFWCLTINNVWIFSFWSFSIFNFLWLIWIAVIPLGGFLNHPHKCSALIVVFDIMCVHYSWLIAYDNFNIFWYEFCFTGFLSHTCYKYTLSQSYSITWLLSCLIVKKLKLGFLDFREALLIKILQAIRVQLDPVMCR